MTAPGGRRGLVLSGGGIRVAWQTGVVTALDEAGLRFAHVDGTSGGIFTTAMLLSGHSPEQMAERWRRLDVRSFLALLPARAYLRPPTTWAAFGGSQGIRRRVLPALGIDLATVRSATDPTGSFNVADFGRKACVAVPHTEIDEDRLIAGVSLAGAMPAVEHGGRTWTDAVWIKDANLTETVRRGCTELWVAWCIANEPRWGRGALEQYVHMMEMSSVAGLTTELTWIADLNQRRARGEAVEGSTEQVVVHLIRPALALPLDVALIAGRIDAETLIAMGYRDAWRYLDERDADGVPLDETPTATPARPLGGRITLRADGRLGAGPACCTLVLEADDLRQLAEAVGTATPVVGALRHPRHGYRMFTGGSAALTGAGERRCLAADCRLLLDGRPHALHVEVPLPVGGWAAVRDQRWTVTRGDAVIDSGRGRMSPSQAFRAVTSFEPSGAYGLRDRVLAARLTRRVLRQHAR